MKLFAYEDDPLNRVAAKAPFHMLDTLRKVPGGQWDRDLKVWHWPATALPRLIQEFPNTSHDRGRSCPTRLGGGQASRWWRGHRAIPAMLARARELNDLKALTAEVAGSVADRGVEIAVANPELTLYDHQVRGCTNALQQVFYACFHQTGTGKTITSAQWLDIVVRPHDGMRVGFVVCPVTLVETAWIPDLERLFPDLPFLNLRAKGIKKGSRYDEVQRAVRRHGRVVVITNYEMVRSDPDVRRAMSGAAVVFDESSKLKNRRASITKTVGDIAPTFRGCLMLSGTPAPNSPVEYYPQGKILAGAGAPDPFPGTLTSFRQTYCTPAPFGGYTFRTEMVDELHRAMSRVAEWVTKEECVDLPEKVYTDVPVPLSPRGETAYREMEDFMRTAVMKRYGEALEQEHTASAVNALSLMMKLRQITAGFIPADRDQWLDSDTAVMVPLCDEKVQWVVDFADSHDGDRFVLWTQFQYEADRFVQALKKKQQKKGWACTHVQIDGRVPDRKRAGLFKQFKDGDVQIAILHPGVAQYGISFPGVSLSVFASCSHSCEQYLQAQDRIHGIGRGDATKHSTFYHLLATAGGDTIDHEIQEVLGAKGQMLKLVYDLDRQRRVST